MTTEQNAFAQEHGVPTSWLKIFKPEENMSIFYLPRAARAFDLTEDQVLSILIKMAAIGLITYSWVDDQFKFELSGASWGQHLRGIPRTGA